MGDKLFKNFFVHAIKCKKFGKNISEKSENFQNIDKNGCCKIGKNSPIEVNSEMIYKIKASSFLKKTDKMNKSAYNYDEAVECVMYLLIKMYSNQIEKMQERIKRFFQIDPAKAINYKLNEKDWPRNSNRKCFYYPGIYISPTSSPNVMGSDPYGYLSDLDEYAISITKPELFGCYLRENIKCLLRFYPNEYLYIGLTNQIIPFHFSYEEEDDTGKKTDIGRIISEVSNKLSGDNYQNGRGWRDVIKDYFYVPDLKLINDKIVDSGEPSQENWPKPLALFDALRVDYSLKRLRHYTGCDPKHFQNFILFTNYQSYVNEFIENWEKIKNLYSESDGKIKYDYFYPDQNNNPAKGGKSLPQMPAYHYCRSDFNGITLINIGVGPSNAKTITDHLAVLRPHAWIMVGHCAGLRGTQKMGEYVLANSYLRDDHVLDAELPTNIPVPAVDIVQDILEEAVAKVTKSLIDKRIDYKKLKSKMRTGIVATIDNRNWELLSNPPLHYRLSQSRAVAIDMESATIAANGFRYRVPYGALLCVSDKPLQGELKLKGMADQFYQESVSQHFQVAIEAMELLRERVDGEGNKPLSNEKEPLHSRKFRSFYEPAFR